jgi:hypothetical protein
VSQEREPGMSQIVSFDLALKVTQYSICHILCVTEPGLSSRRGELGSTF